ncbi:MAG: hypothetical protein CMM30_00005, partial [Rhodospirillaceae bacterium]|nr:hypothetical protein [Rhodospirillaceae bacterium]
SKRMCKHESLPRRGIPYSHPWRRRVWESLSTRLQIEVVNQTLSEIDASDKPLILVFNKTDAYSYTEKEEDDLTPKTKENISLEEWKNTWISKMEDNTIFISALNKSNFDSLRNLLYNKVKELHIKRYPYNNFLY